MKATIDFDDALYRRLKVEAARRGRTVRELVAEGVRYVLDSPEGAARRSPEGEAAEEWRPEWFGALAKYGRAVEDHSMEAVRASVARARRRETRR
ncbi:MAG TPA: hypothetical protein PKC83_08495 [Gemmatimonadaceae bacterium]|jgi:hypothetical protein|nr:MAG: hypothetical protein ABS52_14280 [Gemmatimonadetes bacterium SCN 70-22]HMN08808.1 hypothetical protein [Gemmatimonadaceae bacterium]